MSVVGQPRSPPRRSRSFAELRPPAIQFRRSRQQLRERIGTVQLMGVPPATGPSAASGSQLEPEPDPDDPIQVHIDSEHPENTRIVYRLRAGDGDDAVSG